MEETNQKSIEELADHEINLKEYVYSTEDKVEIPAKLIEGLIDVLGQVRDSETSYGLLSSFPKSSKEIKDENGRLIDVEIKWEDYPNPESYFNQLSQGAVQTTSILGGLALDLLMLLQQIHLENIRSGKAKKVGTFVKPEKQEKNAEVKLS